MSGVINQEDSTYRYIRVRVAMVVKYGRVLSRRYLEKYRPRFQSLECVFHCKIFLPV